MTSDHVIIHADNKILTSVPAMYGLVTKEESSAAECALCSKCWNEENRSYVKELAGNADDVDPDSPFYDVSADETIECAICGCQIGEL